MYGAAGMLVNQGQHSRMLLLLSCKQHLGI
jgi:hypothetical protein